MTHNRARIAHGRQPLLTTLILLGIGLLAACNFPAPRPADTPTAVGLPTPTAVQLPTDTPPPPPTPDPYTDAYRDARGLFPDVCFAYWAEQAGRVFVIDSAGALNALYTEIDEAGLCRFPVTRGTADFTDRLLVGAVNVGTGCTATTDPLELVTDAAARIVTLRVAWGVAGTCDYRLARPFWVSLARPPAGYTVQLEFVPVE